MRIAFLCKRRYMGKDVILDRYARLYEIPYQLARCGHDVLGLCLSYHADADGEWVHEAGPGNLGWRSRTLSRALFPSLVDYPLATLKELRDFKPDVVVAGSDIPHVVLGSWLARRLRVPFAADLYDNFESFGLARIPGVVAPFRRAVRDADIVSCTGNALVQHVRETYACRGQLEALPSTVDRAVFRPLDKMSCRAELDLPRDATLVGTAGGLRLDRGIGTVIDAWRTLRHKRDDVHLVLAGPTDGKLVIPDEPGIHYLGQLHHAKTATLFSALDVGIVYLRDTPFGRFCFPQKAYEMAASGLPFVGAGVGEVAQMLVTAPSQIYRADDADSLAACLATSIESRPAPIPVPQDWSQSVGRLERMLREVVLTKEP